LARLRIAQSDSISHARSELSRKIKLNPTRVATEELQLHDLVIADAYEHHTTRIVSSLISGPGSGRRAED